MRQIEVFCPSCGKQVQEDNNFCPYCSKPLHVASTYQQPAVQPVPQPPPSQQPYTHSPSNSSHTGRNIAIGIIVGIFLIVIVVTSIGYMSSLNSNGGGGNGFLPTTHNVNIVNGLVTVNSNGYEDYTFTVPSGASNIQISGSFTASGGSGNDIKVLVLTQSDFVNWANGHSSQCYYQSGQETTGTISASLPASGTYVLVYDNTFSILSQKNVNTQVNVSYMD